MGKIVAIGGGDALEIHQAIVSLSGKTNPNLLFIPTASSDSTSYYDHIRSIYEGTLGCKTDVLYLLQKTVNLSVAEEKILDSDAIYVGGGNTLKMMRRWRHLGIDNILKTAYHSDIVLSGISAGAICWFSYGHSDSMSFYNPEDWDYVRVTGLGLVNMIFCPHLDAEKRLQNFQEMVAKHKEIGIGLDNDVAIEIVGERFRIITARDGAGGYKVFKHRGKIVTEPLRRNSEFEPLANLLSK